MDHDDARSPVSTAPKAPAVRIRSVQWVDEPERPKQRWRRLVAASGLAAFLAGATIGSGGFQPVTVGPAPLNVPGLPQVP